MTLEELLRETAKRGITHLSLVPSPSEDGKTTYWRAQATPSTMHKYVSCNSLDPVEALTEVLKALPKAPTRSTPKITATVTLTDQPRLENYKLDDPLPDPDDMSRLAVGRIAKQPPEEEIDQWLPQA